MMTGHIKWADMKAAMTAARIRVQLRRGEPSPCPVCAEFGGFHDPVVHGQHVVPRELIKPKDWLK